MFTFSLSNLCSTDDEKKEEDRDDESLDSFVSEFYEADNDTGAISTQINGNIEDVNASTPSLESFDSLDDYLASLISHKQSYTNHTFKRNISRGSGSTAQTEQSANNNRPTESGKHS